MEKEEQFIKRIQELCQNAYQRDIVTFSDFLDLNELHMVNHINYRELGVTLKTCGGYELAERQMAAFIPDALSYVLRPSEGAVQGVCLGNGWEYPMDCLCIQPLAKRFAQPLSHRDYLGAAVNLGIQRSKLGDILVDEKEAYLFCHSSLTEFISGELCRIRNTGVVARKIPDLSGLPERKREEITGTVASVRLDAVLALAFHTSRSQMLPFIETGKVYVNGKMVVSNGYQLKEEDIISVRGQGKFQYSRVLKQTKKDRYSICLYRYR